MNVVLIITAWLIVSFPLSLLIGNCVFVGYGEDQSNLSGDSHE